MATYRYVFRSIVSVASLLLLSCLPSSSDIDQSFDHPVFQSFASFCLPLMNSGDGYGDENIRKFAALANLPEGELRKGTNWHRQPAAKFYSGDADIGAELYVMMRFATNGIGQDYCTASYYTSALPSADQVTAWLYKLDPDWTLTEDTSRNFEHDGKEDVYGTFLKFSKPRSENSCFTLSYIAYEGLRPTRPNPNNAELVVSETDIERLCPELQNVRPE